MSQQEQEQERGICCFCEGDCNPLSQACGRCMRESMYSYIIDEHVLCNLCSCNNYPACEHNEEICKNCVDIVRGFHLKLTPNGDGIANVPENFIECAKCKEFIDPEYHDCTDS